MSITVRKTAFAFAVKILLRQFEGKIFLHYSIQESSNEIAEANAFHIMVFDVFRL